MPLGLPPARPPACSGAAGRLEDCGAFDFDAFQPHLQFFDVRRDFEGGFAADEFAHDEVVEAVVEELHAFGFADADGGPEFFVGFFHDEFSDGGVEAHDFDDGDSRRDIDDGFEQFLSDDALHVHGDTGADSLVHVEGEQVENTGDGSGGPWGVDGSEDEVSGFGGVDGGFEGFAVTHFADEHDIGVFADRVFHGDVEVDDVLADFALVNEAFVGGVDEFDGVLDGQNMLVHIPIDPVEHGGDGCTFSGAGDPGEQDHSLVVLAVIDHAGGKKEFFEGWDGAFDFTRDHADASELGEEVDAEAPGFSVGSDDL